MKTQIFKKAITIKIALLFFAFATFSKEKGISSSDVIIEGKILDTNIYTMPNQETEIFVMVSKYPFNLALMQKSIHKIYKTKVKNQQEFKFIIPALADRFYLSIYYYAKTGAEHWQSGFDNIYMIDKGDSLKCILSNDSFKFTGKGADKLNCQSEIYKTQWKLDDHLMKFYNTKDFPALFRELDRKADSCFVLRKKIIESYRFKLGNELNDIMLANIYGLRYQASLKNQRASARDNYDKYTAFLNSQGYKNIDQINISFSPAIMVTAPIFIDFLFEKIMMETRISVKHRMEINNSADHMERVFNHIKANYNGLVREKLIATFFVQWQKEPSIIKYLDESLMVMKNSPYKDIILELMKKNQRGTPFFPFILENSNGKLVQLQELNDKVLIVDFWYTGCVGCANLKREMEGVWETYKNNDKVRFISISIDKIKEDWKRSVLSRKYTEPEAINLYTNGLGKDHPIISNLQISSYPRMYLLKNGKIYSANLPYPSGLDTSKGTTKDFIELIENAITAN
ncbi:TlpA disulfide reductase family protein [Pedobacter gandavensis]|uniref:TlpA family protein disulfide reductase n=1 Tax=Pedobacter gandavensis TaxID=2679963 RepID=UPI002479FFB0|nr:TlpA disulfide reductase family protein [Pedobacter gandavensis]WGQ09720.1 TlpA disulfide reductase family protein [Pedobacter gandavensis]